MLVEQKLGNIRNIHTSKTVDPLLLEWYELNKRLLHKSTVAGREMQLRFLDATAGLEDGDILYEDAERLIVVEVAPCDAISLKPATMYDMAAICYEIGNKHLPLFYAEESLLVAFEPPLFRSLQSMGYQPVREQRKLLHPLKTTVLTHAIKMLFDKDPKQPTSNT